MATSMGMAAATRRARQPERVWQEAVVAAVEDLDALTRCFTLTSTSEQPLAPFKAGSFIPVSLKAGDTIVEWPFALSSSPREAKQGIYRVIARQGTGGYAPAHIMATWKPGDRIVLGSPFEDDAFSRLSDGDELVGIAGGMGIVSFHSLAKAIAEEEADFHLTLFYSAETANDLLYRDEWPSLQSQARGRLTVVPVLAVQDAEGCKRAPITRAMIERYANPDTAIFLVRGPGSLVAAMRMELAPWNLSRRRLRSSFSGESEFRFPGDGDATHQITIRIGGNTRTTVPAREDETVLEALEKAGLQPAANCRTGICGYCETTLISGSFILATDEAGIRKMNERHGPFHPCCSYPRSDMELIVRRGNA